MAPFFIPKKIMIVRHGGAVVSRSREAWNHADLEFFLCVFCGVSVGVAVPFTIGARGWLGVSRWRLLWTW